MKILIVDDSPGILDALEGAIDSILPAAEVYAAPDVASARKLLHAVKPDIVFLDMVLAQGPSGLNLVPEIAMLGHECHAFVLTGLPREHPDVVTALSLGAFGYLRKPIRRAALLAALQELEAETTPGPAPFGALHGS